MATPTLTTDLSTIANGEATDSGTWSGGKSSEYITIADDGEAFIHGSGSRAYTINQATSYELLYTEATAFGLSTGDTLRIWTMIADFQRLETYANDGMQIIVGDGTNKAYYTVYGSDTYPGGWVQLMVVIGSTPTSGTLPTASNIDIFGIRVDLTSIGKNTNTMWIDVTRYGNKISAYGGTSSDSFGINEIAAVDKTNSYGIILQKNGINLLRGELEIGDSASTNDTYCELDKEVILAADELWADSSSFLITPSGNSTGTSDISITGCFIKSLNDRLVLDASDANIDAFTIDGTTLARIAATTFISGQDIINNVFDDCDQIDPGLSTFENNTISNSTDTGGALLFPSDDSNISDLQFIANLYGVEYDATSDATSPAFDNFVFDDIGSPNFDVNNTSGSAITISIVNTPSGAANSYLPGAGSPDVKEVTFSNDVQVTFTGMKDNTEIRVMQAGSETIELAGIEDATTGTTDDRSFSFTLSAGTNVDYRIGNKFYEIIEVYGYTVPSSATSIPIQQRFDRNYNNP